MVKFGWDKLKRFLAQANTWSGTQTFVTPALGTPASGNLGSCTGYPGLAITAGKTITVTQDTSLDEAVAMSDKAPKASPAFTTKITTPIIDLTGGQIAFPAAQAASADANTLDDYEEETWTLTLTCGTSGTITLNASYNTGYYTKIGHRIFIHGVVLVASVNSPVGVLTMSLPITSSNVAANCQSALTIASNGLEATATTKIDGVIAENANVATISKYAAGVQSALAADIKASTTIWFNGSYIV